ncbi:hypothetical protein ACYOEI_04790, partial [Singulisphaera rosea]
MDYEIFELGDVVLQGGATLRNTVLAYKTYGILNAARDNVIVYPTWFSGWPQDNEWLIGKGMALDPDRYFIIVPCAFGNGMSSSPSNTPEPYNQARFPRVSLYPTFRTSGIQFLRISGGRHVSGYKPPSFATGSGACAAADSVPS